MPWGGATTASFERETPIELFWFLRTDIDDRNTPITTPGSGSGNFYNTATWLGITARDAEGNIVEGLEGIGASGYDWQTGEANPVPLPASAWLLLTGLGLVAARCRRRCIGLTVRGYGQRGPFSGVSEASTSLLA